jgi:hypothetical protein
MNAGTLSVRQKVATELGVLAVLTISFLMLWPRRNPLVDVALAGFALLCIAITSRYTRNVVWAVSPPPIQPHRCRRATIETLWVTAPTVLVFFLIVAILKSRADGWAAVAEMLFNWKTLAVFGAYIGWALIQQTLFQFYLLGRLLALFPRGMSLWPISIAGLGFSLVHLPDVPTTLVTAVAGVVWTVIYYRYRCLLPVAISHATLGTAFYYWVCGHDLAREWSIAVSRAGLH